MTKLSVDEYLKYRAALSRALPRRKFDRVHPLIRWAAVVLLAVILGFGLAEMAKAQGTTCLPHDAAVAKLKQTFGEVKVGLGLGQSGAYIVELFISDKGTWTVLITRTNGMSCVAGSGDNWTSVPVTLGPEA